LTKPKSNVTYGAGQGSGGPAALLIPPRALPVRVRATFVKQDVRCEAERLVQLVCCLVGVSDGGYSRGRGIADQFYPLIMFRVVYNPSLPGRRMGVGTGKRK
jgi:hypothetical protein